jgi:EAL domain-containing protein (putative c-di-GMP-specific phosphodiesterase class I)
VTVNLFDEHLERRDLPTRVEHLMHDNEVPAAHGLAFEVGEHQLRPEHRRNRDRLTMLHNLGVDIIVDDFGAAAAATDLAPDALRDWATEGFATLGAVPLDAVKLAPSLVRGLETDARLRAVIEAAHATETAVVALAVEDEEMATRARQVGFDLAQGFHFARPERPTRIDELLAAA